MAVSDSVMGFLARYRGRLQAGLDASAWFVGIYVAVWLRFEMDLDMWKHQRLLLAFLIAAALQLCLGSVFGLYQRRWRFASFEETRALAATVVVVTMLLSVLNLVAFQPRLVPISVAVGAGLVATAAMAATRYVWRMILWRRMRPGDRAERVLVFGAGEAGEQLVTAMLRNPASRMLPVGFLDDDPGKRRMRIRGVPVLGTRDDVSAAVQRTHARRLVIAVPSGSAQLFREVSQLANDAGVPVGVLPAVEELLVDGEPHVSVADVRPIDVRDLLGRPQVQTDIDQIAGYITGRRVLVTGAGGSIGSELCRQLHRLAPEQLVMLDRDEGGLHKVSLQLTGRALLNDRNLVVADIRDLDRMREVFAEHLPEVVFHAAALKHMPLLEMHPSEGVKTNIWGTQNLLEVSGEFGVDRFVNISTDKAAAPENVLGYTKRIAERLTAHAAAKNSGTYLSVRFGNVLGSRGSVLETFQAQIAAGGPVTVVHPDVTRFFMTAQEAVELVIQAGAIGRDGEALVLDMGEPVSIDAVARQLISQADRPINIEYTGLRPGEKLHEVLFGPNEIGVADAHPLITHVEVPAIAPMHLTVDTTVDQQQLVAGIRRSCAPITIS